MRPNCVRKATKTELNTRCDEPRMHADSIVACGSTGTRSLWTQTRPSWPARIASRRGRPLCASVPCSHDAALALGPLTSGGRNNHDRARGHRASCCRRLGRSCAWAEPAIRWFEVCTPAQHRRATRVSNAQAGGRRLEVSASTSSLQIVPPPARRPRCTLGGEGTRRTRMRASEWSRVTRPWESVPVPFTERVVYPYAQTSGEVIKNDETAVSNQV